MIDGHGDDIFRYGGKIRINFSTNIPQSVDHSGLLEHLSKQGDIFRNYPEPEPRRVEQKLADVHGVEAENVIVTNGATEAIYLLAHAFAGSRSAIISPTFREYQDACGLFNHSVGFIATINEIRKGFDMVWLCNPNNPTGIVYDRSELLRVIDNNPDILFIIDQAYMAYSVKDVLSVSDVMARKNIVMLHSLTKRFIVPGLRIGYAIGDEAVISRVRSMRIPWSVNTVAIESALYLIDNASHYRIDACELHAEATRLAEMMRSIGLKVCDTDCNFILAQLPDRTAAELKDWLIDNHGILIRDASNFEGLTSRHFRVAAQSRNENINLINALKEWTLLSR
ncbi:histidinol-phosphate transaminase [uncultured Duncaniella sp.]|uniref:pyridoxal phosphate-dependent aminotransferase n=1 Tax=uncultured Duncaniella sp. TaxID=2768039 RepID=UPI0026752F72|nr:aminotransferase class I/II-fold pyridoxal phosphate-dependent enzyme [uncultured Duncaniella sp.]